MKFAVIQFPGSNCDFDLLWAIRDVMGAEAEFVWHDEKSLAGFDGVLIPGAFLMVIIYAVVRLRHLPILCRKSNVWLKKGNRFLALAMDFKFWLNLGFYRVY